MIISLDINISNGNRGTVDGVKCRFLFGSHPIISYFSLIALSSSSNSIQLSQPPFTFTSSLPKGIHFFLSFSFFLRSSYFSLSLFFLMGAVHERTYVCVSECMLSARSVSIERFTWLFRVIIIITTYYFAMRMKTCVYIEHFITNNLCLDYFRFAHPVALHRCEWAWVFLHLVLLHWKYHGAGDWCHSIQHQGDHLNKANSKTILISVVIIMALVTTGINEMMTSIITCFSF